MNNPHPQCAVARRDKLHATHQFNVGARAARYLPTWCGAARQ